jgi:hypothetical protein
LQAVEPGPGTWITTGWPVPRSPPSWGGGLARACLFSCELALSPRGASRCGVDPQVGCHSQPSSSQRRSWTRLVLQKSKRAARSTRVGRNQTNERKWRRLRPCRFALCTHMYPRWVVP